MQAMEEESKRLKGGRACGAKYRGLLVREVAALECAQGCAGRR